MTEDDDPKTDVSDQTTDATTLSHQATTWKVLGQLDTIDAAGVLGHNLATNGTGTGVEGVTDSTDDETAGVRGVATASSVSAETYGVHGKSSATGDLNGPTPSGVKGDATGDGENAGVYGATNSAAGRAAGVKAEATTGNASAIQATAAEGTGIEVTTGGDGSYALWARHTGASGTSRDHGIVGESTVDVDGVAGVVGSDSIAGTARTNGVKGEVLSSGTGAAGVRGQAKQESGQTYGVKGETLSSGTGASGVRGRATQGSGETYGVFGKTDSNNTNAAGVKGISSGEATGVEANSNGIGLSVTGNSRSADDTPTPEEHAAFIYDAEFVFSSVLALKTEDRDPLQSATTNFITFYDRDDVALGAVEGDGNGNLVYTSGSADYAEFMPRVDPDEQIDEGEVVGVVGGEVTKRTSDAEQAMVVTSQPIVTGNDPGQSPQARRGYETVAFVGQVPVKLRGTVAEGDLIVPSGAEDGTARAIASEDWTPSDGPLVGRAWESTDEEDVDQVIVAVGLETGEAVQRAHEVERLRAKLDRKDDRIEDLEQELERLRAENETIKTRLAGMEDRLTHLEASGSTPASADD